MRRGLNFGDLFSCLLSFQEEKNQLFFYFKTTCSIYVPQQLFNRTQFFFSQALDCKVSSILNLAWNTLLHTHTHTSHVWSLLLFKVANTSLSSKFFWPSITLCLQASVRRRSIGFQPARILQSDSNERFPA